jgi:AcrR family transcriptional regulator
MAKSTRERLLEVADDLFYRDGFHAVGLDRLLDEVGVTKTTFYNHFESKDALILAVLTERDHWWREEFIKMLRARAGDDARKQLECVMDVVADLFNSREFTGCIFVNVSAEIPLPHDPVHMAASEHKSLMELILRDLALRAGATDAVAMAEQLAMLMEGAYVTHQVTRNPRTGEIAKRTASMLLERYLTSTTPSASPSREHGLKATKTTAARASPRGAAMENNAS